MTAAPHYRALAKAKRDRMRQRGLCINATEPGNRSRGVVHGEVWRGGKCKRCCAVSAGTTISI